MESSIPAINFRHRTTLTLHKKCKKYEVLASLLCICTCITSLWCLINASETFHKRRLVKADKILYREVVRIFDYESVVISLPHRNDEVEKVLRNRPVTDGSLQQDEDLDVVRYRIRRESRSQAQYGGEYPRQRRAGSHAVPLRNGIDELSEDLELESSKKDKGGSAKPEKNNSTNEEEDPMTGLSEMEITYRKHLAICEAQQRLNFVSNDTHINGTGEHADGHHDKCKSELESDVPALWILLYVVIVFFLFIGLAIICDDFFVPSLQAISDRLNLSEDVAGATFMAAGSSAPELFTSVAGVGVGSDVGVGTIVGSAVFNLLVIIALTSALAGKVLCLDWRPFIRDSIFYALSIVAFIVFSLDTVFYFWESLALLSLYVLYIITMKFNAQLMNFMASWTCFNCFTSKDVKVSPQEDAKIEIDETSPRTNPFTSQAEQNTVEKELKNQPEFTYSDPPPNPNLKLNNSVPAASGEDPVSSPSAPPAETVTNTTPTQAKNINTLSGTIAESKLPSPVSCSCNCCVIHVTSQQCGSIMTQSPVRCPSCSSVVSQFGDGAKEEITIITGSQPKANNCSPAPRVSKQNQYRPTSTPGASENGSALLRSNSTMPYDDAGNCNRKAIDSLGCNKTRDNEVVVELNYTEEPGVELGGPTEVDVKQNNAEEEEESIQIFSCLPAIKFSSPTKPDSSECVPGTKYVASYVVFILSFPWICAFTWTVPDCSKPGKRKWYLASFFLCILWIAFISFIMVELVEKTGCLLGIDAYTMGLVVVAVGTSVPDAISSVLVARDGFGDMAVSNAVGSNVFDINLGLGLPFFLGSLITSKPVSLLSPLQLCLFDSLPLAVKIVPHVKFGFILLLILAVAVMAFMLVRFRLNKAVGVTFVAIYLAFLVYAFIQERKCHMFFC